MLRLNTSKSAEMDQIPATFLRDGAEVLPLPLKNIINLSIKLSKKLILKKGVTTHHKNYQPISLLQLVSKLTEKLIYFQIEDCLNKKK